MKFKSQIDPRWANNKIGNTNYTIGQFGCLISCFAMILEINPPDISRHSEYFNKDAIFIRQPKCASDFGGQYSTERSKALYNPVICETTFDGSMHFVVRYNNRIYDPLTLGGWPLRNYKILSYRNLKKGDDDMKREDFGYTIKFKDKKNVFALIKDPEVFKEEFNNKVNYVLIHPSDLTDTINKLKDQIKLLNNKVKELSDASEEWSDKVVDLSNKLENCKTLKIDLDKQPLKELLKAIGRKIINLLNKLEERN